jgi:chitinase
MSHNNWEEVDGALQMMMRAGVKSNKILLGLGYYGRSFKLADKNCNRMRECNYQDPGPLIPEDDNYTNLAKPGRCTKAGGILGLFEINEIIRNQGVKPEYDEKAVTQMLVYNNGEDWIGYDDDFTISLKLKRADEMCLGGYIVWALDLVVQCLIPG